MIEVTENNIEKVLGSKKITLLQFSAEWCNPCKMLSPIVKKISEENEGKDLNIGKINVDSDGPVAARFNVRNIPTLIYLNKDGEVVDRMVGQQPKETIQAKLDELLK
jgi:thioredoxin 1